ncbi:uncharacterized protein LOC131887678 [Tigriopus californicus]|uniref:uncharacterized protein LOC131887678 n=1 Tax=Tigriopus californicus TaxID=6832 RepID=UPI0027D9D9DD|nr:uncharacterized protein LOC131887678 [Tigriopus californicus]
MFKARPTPTIVVHVLPPSGTPFTMDILPDTGATESLISADLARTYGIVIDTLRSCSIRAANNSKMRCYGAVDLIISRLGKYKASVTTYVTPDLHNQFLLSWHGMIELGMLPNTFPLLPEDAHSNDLDPSDGSAVQIRSTTSEPCGKEIEGAINMLMEKFQSVFDCSQVLKPMKGDPMVIHLRDDIPITPTHVNVARNIPFAYQEMTKEELKSMTSSGVMEEAPEPSLWVSPSLVIPKPNGSAIGRSNSTRNHGTSQHSSPLLGASVIVEPQLGLNASGDEFCARGDRALSGLVGVRKIVDDILICGESKDDLIQKTKAVLQRCADHSITLSKAKAQVGSSVKFAGYIISRDGVSPDPSKVATISKFPAPTNLTDLRSFLGLANQLGHFVPDLAHASQPLRNLLKKEMSFQWLSEHEEAFRALRKF